MGHEGPQQGYLHDEDLDTFAPVFATWPRRAIWLSFNLLAAFAAASVINLFQGSIEKVVALAVLMPIVASMGGVSGTQAFTVVIRGMTLEQINPQNRNWLLSRELTIGLLNGLLWSMVIAIAAALWFSDPLLGAIIAAAVSVFPAPVGICSKGRLWLAMSECLSFSIASSW